jgi:microcystin-dependent protein
MSDPYIGQIEAFGFGYAPRNWVTCSGQTLPISQYQALFSLLGTTYGGDGVRTFMLPDLRGRVAMGQGNGPGLTPRTIGQVGGEENHTLTAMEMPPHTHTLRVTATAAPATNVDTPGPSVVLGQTTGIAKDGTTFALNLYAADANPTQTMSQSAIGLSGGQPHPNLMPYLALNYCISLNGIFPSRN